MDNVCERSAVVFAQEDDSCLIVHKAKGRFGHAGCCTKDSHLSLLNDRLGKERML